MDGYMRYRLVAERIDPREPQDVPVGLLPIKQTIEKRG